LNSAPAHLARDNSPSFGKGWGHRGSASRTFYKAQIELPKSQLNGPLPAAPLPSASPASSGSRVRGVIGLLQAVGGDMGVNLRRHQMRMAEQFLHAAQVRASVQ